MKRIKRRGEGAGRRRNPLGRFCETGCRAIIYFILIMSEQEEGPPGFTGGIPKRERERERASFGRRKKREVNGRIRCRIRSVFKLWPREKSRDACH